MDPIKTILPTPTPTQTTTPVEKPVGIPSDPFDTTIIAGGASAVVISQYWSKTYPTLAREIAANAIGPQVALGQSWRPSWSLSGGLLYGFPKPIGLAPPEDWGLNTNYGNQFNKTLTWELGLPPSIGIPESEFLRTLPDNDPRVQYANYRRRAYDQVNEIEVATSRAPIEEVLTLYNFVNSPNAGKYFYDPSLVANSVEVTVRSRVGVDVGDQLLQQSLVKAGLLMVPKDSPYQFEGPLPQLIDIQKPLKQVTTHYGELPDLFAYMQSQGAKRGIEQPPANTNQREAYDRAKGPVRDLITERGDP